MNTSWAGIPSAKQRSDRYKLALGNAAAESSGKSARLGAFLGFVRGPADTQGESGVRLMLAVDWSGDAGVAGKTGVSTYFALAVVAYEEEEIAGILAQLRRDQRLPDRFEYHFAEGPSNHDHIRHGFMQALTRSSMRTAILSGNKAALAITTHQQGVSFLAAHICDLLEFLPLEQIDGASMVIDGTTSETKRLCAIVMSLMKPWPNRPNRPRGMRSHQCDGIQVADMLAGAARHRVAGKTPDYLVPLKGKIILKEMK